MHTKHFSRQTNSPATAATIISFWAGLELTSSQLSYLKRKKKDKRESIEGKSCEDNMVTYLHSPDDLSYMCLYDTVLYINLFAGRNKGCPPKSNRRECCLDGEFIHQLVGRQKQRTSTKE
jgi:hypothetical protein